METCLGAWLLLKCFALLQDDVRCFEDLKENGEGLWFWGSGGSSPYMKYFRSCR